MKKYLLILIGLCLTLLHSQCFSQDSLNASTQASSISKNAVKQVNKKTLGAITRIQKTNSRYLNKFKRSESKLKKQIWKKDSLLAKQLFHVNMGYDHLKSFSYKSQYKVYSGHLDSMITFMKFQENINSITDSNLQNGIAELRSLQNEFNHTETIKKYISVRQKLLTERLENTPWEKKLKSLQKDFYYYKAIVNDCKTAFEDPSKIEKRIIDEALKSTVFKEFFEKNSEIAAMFRLPGTGNSDPGMLSRLQTRSSVSRDLINRFGSTTVVTDKLRSNLADAQSKLNELKTKAAGLQSKSRGNGELDEIKSFKPNSQKTKPFLKRIEYGFNLQSQKSNNFYPVTSDVALSLNYKLHDKSSLGIGVAYKIGFGQGFKNFKLTHEGIGVRSYIDLKIKHGIYVAGGYELNYRQPFKLNSNIQYLPWQKSGLIGLNKKYKISKKLNGNMQLLWDFLSYQQLPATQPIVFRIGYTFK